MKRLLIALLIVCTILGSASWSLWQFSALRSKAAPLLRRMEQAADEGNLPAGTSASEEFLELWLSYEGKLLPFVRQDPLEAIGSCAVRLPALAEHGDEAEFAAVARELHYRMDELWESEIPSLNNLL